MKNPPVDRYYARIAVVLAFIDKHLEEDLNVEKLSEVAGFSSFHFHRQFLALTGINLSKYVRLRRLKRAAYSLAYRDDKVTEIALDAGYESLEAFIRAFKKNLGTTPSEFRNDADWSHWQEAGKALEESRRKYMVIKHQSTDVQIENHEAIHLAVIEHRDSKANLPASIQKFIAWRRANKLGPNVSATYNIFYGDPDDETLAIDLGAQIKEDNLPSTAGIIVKTIPAGRAAVLRHTGPDDLLEKSILYLYRQWLPESLEEPAGFPVYCKRVNFFPDVPEHEAVTDIYLPLID